MPTVLTLQTWGKDHSSQARHHKSNCTCFCLSLDLPAALGTHRALMWHSGGHGKDTSAYLWVILCYELCRPETMPLVYCVPNTWHHVWGMQVQVLTHWFSTG